MHYLHGNAGIMGFAYRDYHKDEIIHYYYVKNLFGDVVELWRASDNTLVAKYVYDAWGNCRVLNPNGTYNTDSTFIGNVNPIRYRSYYWDSDVQLYYLHTRWYDPEIGRFINLDQLEYLNPKTVNGFNLYAYCLNNPVMGVDPYGTIVGIALAIGTIFIGGLLFLNSDAEQVKESQITEDDLNIDNNNPKGHIEIEIKADHIRIYDSYKIANVEDMEAIMRIIMAHPSYRNYGFNRSMDSYIREWKAHNRAYSIWPSEQAKHVDMEIQLNWDYALAWWVLSLFY